MQALEITTTTNEISKDGLGYHFIRSGIEYSVFLKTDRIDVYKTNTMCGLRSTATYWPGQKMPKFLANVIKLVQS